MGLVGFRFTNKIYLIYGQFSYSTCVVGERAPRLQIGPI